MHEPELFDLIKTNIGRLTGEELQFSENEWAQPLKPNSETAKQPDVATEAIAYLFPRLGKAWNVMIVNATDEHAAKRERRIACADYARNYFALSPSRDQYSRAEIEALFAASEPEEVLTTMIADAKARKTRKGLTMVSRLIEQMTEFASGEAGMRDELMLAVLKFSDEITAVRDEERIFFSIDNSQRLNWLFVNALRVLRPEDRTARVKSWLASKQGMSFLVPFVEIATSKGAQGSVEELFALEDHDALRVEALARVTDVSDQSDFLRRPRCGRLIWAWVRLANEATVRAWLAPKLGTTTSSCDWLASCRPRP